MFDGLRTVVLLEFDSFEAVEWMAAKFDAMRNLFSEGVNSHMLLAGHWGLEREGQRITSSGDLALTDHPAVFGNKLTNPQITTDFAESQLELITPALPTIEDTYESLLAITREAEAGIETELLWPLSMPPRLPEEEQIPIARFDDSPEGRERSVYRQGLALRYGKKMQMISGVHYNYSFSEELLELLRTWLGQGETEREFRDNLYFGVARNFLRYRWLPIYLFGASPVIDISYQPVIRQELKLVEDCCPECRNLVDHYQRYATSLRVSRFGYSDAIQRQYPVSYNSLAEYVGDIRRLLSIHNREYARLGLVRDGQPIQLNANVLQKESEFYAAIRLKRAAGKGRSQLDALEDQGVQYLEVRTLDLNPYEKAGISLDQLYFLQVFLAFCLFEESKPMGRGELQNANQNHHLAALLGRRPRLMLHRSGFFPVALRVWASELFKKLAIVASLMDRGGDGKYRRVVEAEYRKVLDLSLLPAARILQEMAEYGESHAEFGLDLAGRHRNLDNIRKWG